MSKSFQEIVDIFNPKKSTDKISNSKETNNKSNINDKIINKLNSNKINDNNNQEKKSFPPLINTNTAKGYEDLKSRERRETILLFIRPEQNKKKEIKNNQEKKIQKKENDDFLLIEKNNLSQNLKLDSSEKQVLKKLEFINDSYKFKEEDYIKRRYDKNNVEKTGKKYFRYRYLNQITTNKITKESENICKDRILRKYNSDFILTVEKSILSFNIKNYKDSYDILINSSIIKNVAEYGEFLLVVSGFDKFLLGEFLAKQKYPNDKKEVLNNFIESINMKNSENSFLDCLRFLFSRLILPKDANLILEIMDKFSVNFFEVNKNDPKFVETFKSSDKIYLLVSTILALNTMFTRKDIKIKNVINEWRVI